MSTIPCFRDLKGNVITVHDLPNPKDRWVANKKYMIVMAVKHGMLSQEDCQRIYATTSEEIKNWALGFSSRGVRGLHTTKLIERTDIIPLIRIEK